ncbi:MAG: CPBP family intramembrane glutamic endopeptidase [Flavobacteriales bacterium]
MLYNVWKYIKNPVYREYHNSPSVYKKTISLSLLKWNLIIGLAIVVFNYGLSEVFGFDMGEYSSEKLFSQNSTWIIFLTVSIMAPIIEEALFRGPLVYFRNSPFFKYVFYTSVLLFAIVHIFNFEGDTKLYYFTPFLIAPQLITGVFLGYIRVKLGLKWSILLHATFNTVLIGPILLLKILNIPME